MKELSERKIRVLNALVDLYISTGQPVSSADIQKLYLPEISSATVRSEMSALEALGYIDQPHTSAGRVPLNSAYKQYVKSLESRKGNNMITTAETAFIKNQFEKKLWEVEDISKRAAKIISDVTNYTSFCVQNTDTSVGIEEIKLIPLKNNQIVVMVVTEKGVIANNTIEIEKDMKPEYVETACILLNKIFIGKQIGEISNSEIEISEEIKAFRDIFDNVIQIIRTYVSDNNNNVIVEGALKMLDYPEYNNIEDAKNFLTVISTKDGINDLIFSDEENIEFSIKIGKEDKGVDKCAIITATYRVGDEIRGKAGVIGPERMDYKKVYGVLECIKRTMSTILNGTSEKDIAHKSSDDEENN